MAYLIAIVYPEDIVAGQAVEELERHAPELLIDADALGAIVCERDGSHQLTSRHHNGANARWSLFWGLLMGVLMGNIAGTAIEPRFQDSVSRVLTPGASALFMVVEKVEPAIAALSQYGGTVLRCFLPDEEVFDLRLVEGFRSSAHSSAQP
jgi:uncharacterized membrane protein